MSDAPVTSPLLAIPGMDADRERIEAAMRAAVVTADPYLTEIASHLIVAGGKRLRPVLTIVAGQIVGGPVTDDLVQGGVACELVQTGSLYHDDVMDEAETRRGVETVNARWGNLQAILAGDFLLSRASEIAASLGTEVAGLLARTIGWLCEGQIEELRHTYDVERSEVSYLASIHGKTASLYGTAARIGGIVGGHDRATIDALTEYGNAFGMVFQIVDDVLDLTATAEQLGKPAGHDLEEGVYTLPVLRTLAVGDATADELRDLLGSPLEPAERDKALAIVRSNGGIPSAMETARDYVGRATTACEQLGDGPVVDALRAAPGALLATVLPEMTGLPSVSG
ncbi:MAG: polyprenyl synthetase family protein [Ilumatobacter sp.]|uniref:polyprenyl synthetase family protein n=1 Tax=Ilumatobacter sp. TaxID=1967498 RepID=UPI002635D4A4|nr:polyprenyl synthetase family protein [Ilumatobacter sp.]MDJ0768534.1 polyprenyl synthetase family protein [Ilumatobacter sp.]